MSITEAGKYRAKARGWQVGEAGTHTLQVGVQFDLLDHPGDTLTWYGSMTDKALPRTMDGLRAMGWQGCDISELDDPATEMDNEVVLVVEWDEYQGKKKLKVNWVNAAGGGMGMKNPLAGDALKAKAAELKAKILALDPANAAKYAAHKPTEKKATAPGQAKAEDPDIPF